MAKKPKKLNRYGKQSIIERENLGEEEHDSGSSLCSILYLFSTSEFNGVLF